MALRPVSTGQEKGKSALSISTWWYEMVLYEIYLWTKRVQTQTAHLEIFQLNY